MSESAIALSATLAQPALEAWGRRVGAAVAGGEIGPPLVVALRGPLGAGKSVLARAVAAGAGVHQHMPSPTYNLVFGYDGDGVRVHHLDLYRLEHPDDVWELGWQELGQGDEIVLIEWPERAEELLPEDRWEVKLSFAEDEAERGVVVHRLGDAPEVPPVPEPDGPDPNGPEPDGEAGA